MATNSDFYRIKTWPDLKQGTEVWQELRENCDLTSTQLGPACNLGKYKSRATLLREKLKFKKKNTDVNIYMQMGHYYEKHIARAFESIVQYKLHKFGFVTGMWNERLFGASPDRVFYDDDGRTHIVEIKFSLHPITAIHPQHALQMLLCSKLMKASVIHYVCWSPCMVKDGCFELNHWELGFHPDLWNKYVTPCLRDYFKALDRKMVSNCNTTMTKQLEEAIQRYIVNEGENEVRRKRYRGYNDAFAHPSKKSKDDQ